MRNDLQEFLDIDINDIEPRALTIKRKAEIKQHVLRKKKKAKKGTFLHTLTAAALIGVTVITGSIISVPVLANHIPFIQNIMEHFKKDTLPNEYVDLATVVNQVQSSNGIDIIIENAVYDGTNVIITYAIQTTFDLGSQPRSEGFIDIEDVKAIGGTGYIDKMNETTYVGVEKITPHFDGKSPEDINIKWEPKVFENSSDTKRYEGDWSFEFSLTQLQTSTQLLNKKEEYPGITLNLKSFEHSKMASVLQYEFVVDRNILKESPFISIEMSNVTDNLGNKYDVNSNGGVSLDDGAFHKSEVSIYSIHPDARTLTFTPQIYYSKGSGMVLNVEEMQPISIYLK